MYVFAYYLVIIKYYLGSIIKVLCVELWGASTWYTGFEQRLIIFFYIS
jgi:hypothetical protein